MSVAGFKKQFYKASQFVSEKVGGAEGTKLDDDFTEMEKKYDTTNKAVMDIITKTQEYLQPNPASRAKLGMLNTMSKIRGQVKSTGYPQPEGLLGEAMAKYGKDMGTESCFGLALADVGESMKQMAEIKDSLDIDVKQNFLDPMQALQDKELKEIGHHLKKLEGRRLDFDYKKKRLGKIPDEEIRQAEEKFEESREVAASSMHNLVESEIEQVSQLAALVDAQLEYHQRSAAVLQDLQAALHERKNEASKMPKKEFKAKPMSTFHENSWGNGGGENIFPAASASASSSSRSPAPLASKAPGMPSRSFSKKAQTPSAKALYDFDPENEGELGFQEGDIITLTKQIDDNWYEGTVRGHSGFFPVNYVDVIVPLQH
ncbi:endophilin-A2-like isoform X1 [Lethenteron reissneri]|uniref:endophilin-A2-like isoform X1 n=1 Tax=Lethenteron reissneri TaxID=7753 RepID=UPI002AB786DC|nr:endophilin-A2-like isoform X1 [Lethenteron reissneri]